ncbi:MAG: Fic family protein [Geodermatophilaceae bacterium]|nr:Fic family protein [Geodermatophilaceae bacterium]
MTWPPDDVDFLTVDDVQQIADGVLPQVIVRDAGLLESAVARPMTFVFGTDAYPSFAEKAAALMHSLARNHALLDGNKRLGWAATRVLCLMNGRDLILDVDQAEAMVLSVAAGELDVPELADTLQAHLSEGEGEGI